jgi:hypothetical protein
LSHPESTLLSCNGAEGTEFEAGSCAPMLMPRLQSQSKKAMNDLKLDMG